MTPRTALCFFLLAAITHAEILSTGEEVSGFVAKQLEHDVRQSKWYGYENEQ